MSLLVRENDGLGRTLERKEQPKQIDEAVSGSKVKQSLSGLTIFKENTKNKTMKKVTMTTKVVKYCLGLFK